MSRCSRPDRTPRPPRAIRSPSLAALAALLATAALGCVRQPRGGEPAAPAPRGDGARAEASAAWPEADAGPAVREAQPLAAAPRPCGALGPAVRLGRPVELVAGSGRVAVLTGDDRWLEVTAAGLVEDRSASRAVRAALAEAGDEVELLLGHDPIASEPGRLLRAGRRRQVVTLPGRVFQAAAVEGGPEAFRVGQDLAMRLAFVAASGSVALEPPFPTLGPRVPGLSDLGEGSCAEPVVFRIAAAGRSLVALVAECHREAPLRLVTYRWPGPSREERRLPSAAEAGLEPEALAADREGRVVVAGLDGGRLALARPTAEGSWDVARSEVRAVAVAGLALSEAGAAWSLALGADEAGRDGWTLACEGARVEPRDPSGRPLVPTALASDRDVGVVLLAHDGASRWLLFERPPAAGPTDL